MSPLSSFGVKHLRWENYLVKVSFDERRRNKNLARKALRSFPQFIFPRPTLTSTQS